MARKKINIAPLSKLLSASSAPIYALDRQRTIVYCNKACAALLRADIGEILGLQCNFHSGSAGGATSDMAGGIAGGLAPPPEVYHGQPVTADIHIQGEAEQSGSYQTHFFPLPSDGEPCNGVLAIVEIGKSTPPQTGGVDWGDARELHKRLWQLRGAIAARYKLGQIIGESPAMQCVQEQVRIAVACDANVTIVGPAGSGREHIARVIQHHRGQPNPPPLAPLACNLLDAELLESTLTTFIASCAELEIEQTPALLLLDVDQLPPDAQMALAGVLSIGELQFRTIATARTSPRDLARRQEFRSELAFALTALVIEVPPLSSRPADIPLLAQAFLEEYNARGNRQFSGFSPAAMDQLQAYNWPGNADELSDVVAAACDRSAGPYVAAHELPEQVLETTAVTGQPPRKEETIKLDEFLAEIEEELLRRALRRAKGNKAAAARLLGIPRARVIRRAEHFDIQ